MIDDWREKKALFLNGTSRSLVWIWLEVLAFVWFSNRYVIQLAQPTRNENQTVGVVQWAQAANYGYDRPQNVFMAVVINLRDPTSPYECTVHPRDKQDIGSRLARSGRAAVYKDQT